MRFGGLFTGRSEYELNAWLSGTSCTTKFNIEERSDDFGFRYWEIYGFSNLLRFSNMKLFAASLPAFS